MKKIILLVLVLFSFCMNGQNKGKVEKTGTAYSSEQLLNAVNGADWCGVIHKNKNYTLKFEDGAIVSLFSAEFLATKNIQTDLGCIQEEITVDKAIYSIHSSGVLLRRVEKNNNVKFHE